MANELTPQESERVKELRRALESEFATREQSKGTIEDIVELKEDALETLRHTMRFSQNDTLRTKIAMWAYEKILDSERADDQDALKRLLEGMPAAVPAQTD